MYDIARSIDKYRPWYLSATAFVEALGVKVSHRFHGSEPRCPRDVFVTPFRPRA